MCHARLIFLLPVLPLAMLAENLTTTGETPLPPPSYKILRFDEDYSCLTNPANRSDWFDPVKYIPLRENEPYWYLSFGGELRERFEGIHDDNFGIGSGPDSYWLQRVTLLGDLHLGERVRVFAQGISGVIAGETQPAAPNIPFKFDGFEILYARPLWEATAFLTRPVKDSGGFDGEDHSTAFWGLYLTHWLAAPDKFGIDLYYLGVAREHGRYASGTGDEHRHSLGAREFGAWHGWDWDGEQVVQFGSFGSDSILAWTVAMNAGYTWDALWRPRLG